MREVILIVWLCALTAPILSAQAPNCSQWNTKAFFRAATVDDVTTCLSASADPMARDKEGVRPLHWTAALSRDPSVVEVLLKAGADPNAQDDTKNTPLHLAAGYNEDPAAVKLLLAAGANIKARDQRRSMPLHLAAGYNENPAVIEALLKAGAHLEARNDWGNTPLHRAAEHNQNPAVLEALLAAGADSRATNEDGHTPLSLATERNKNPTVGQILKEDANAKRTCSGKAKNSACWMELADHPRCSVWNPRLQPGETVTWSGHCSGKRAQGRGTLRWVWDGGKKIAKSTGFLKDGQMHGNWVLHSPGGHVEEGRFVHGRKHGKWVFRIPNGNVLEGPMVDGQMHGKWVVRFPSGTVSEGTYLDGKRHGQWVLRFSDGGVEAGPYENGKRHGRWVGRDPRGHVREWAVRQVFIIRFSDGGKIAVFNDEIHFDGLAEWMDQRGVSGVEEVKKNIFRDEYLDRFHNRK